MDIRCAAALLYAVLSAGVVAFQIALAAGAPWGAYAMGGAVPGQFPPPLRIAALVQAALVVGMAAIVMSRAGLILAGWSHVTHWLVWVIVAVTAMSFVLNLITPSVGEQALWAPEPNRGTRACQARRQWQERLLLSDGDTHFNHETVYTTTAERSSPQPPHRAAE